MKKSVYLVSGDNLPTKLAVVASELEHSTLLEIENRFEPKGGYNCLTPIHKGVVKLADPMFGPHDQAYFPGYDSYKGRSKEDSVGRDPSKDKPGEIVQEGGSNKECLAYLVAITRNEVTNHLVMVWGYNEQLSAQMVAQAFGADAPAGTAIEVKLIGSGTFQVTPEIAQHGFQVRVGDPATY
jgi:hypothetical protein